jgi:hypothetical protein
MQDLGVPGDRIAVIDEPTENDITQSQVGRRVDFKVF